MRDRFAGKRGQRPFEPEPQTEVDDELTFHLEQRIRDYVARGMDPAAARAAALERLGNLAPVRAECTELLKADRRAATRRDWLDDLRQDLFFGVRSALRAPLFTLLAVLTLALGIGANAAVFGVVKSVLLDALPYADADRLVRVYGRFLDGSMQRMPLSAGTAADVADRQRSFAGIAMFMMNATDVVYGGDDGPRGAKAAAVEPRLFHMLGIPAALGRVFATTEASPTNSPVILVTHSGWQRLFAGDPGLVGRAVRIDGNPWTVIGVLPRDFVGPTGEADFYFALDIAPSLRNPVAARGQHWLGIIGRLAPGVTVDAAQREMATIAADLARDHPRENGNVGLTVIGLRDAMVGDTRTPLLVLMASAGLVLLITCANLAGALLARTISRRQEFAVRVALGAGRGRLVRQLLTESTVLAITGGVVGIGLAAGGLALLRKLALPALPSYAELTLDSGAVLVTFGLAVVTGLVFGLAPALSVGRADPQRTLREEARGTSESRRSQHLRGALVAGQIALCVSLLAGAGLLVRSLLAMTAAPLGLDPEGVLTATVRFIGGPRYGAVDARVRFQEQLAAQLRIIPAVRGVATASALPGAVVSRTSFSIVGAPWESGGATPSVLYASVSDDYFHTLGIPLRRGRVFASADRAGAPPVVIISETMARLYWPNADAVGSHIRMGPDADSPALEVIGVVGDVRNDPTRPDAEPMAYAAGRQLPWSSVSLLLRTSGDPLALVHGVERELAALDPGLALDRAMPLHELLAAGIAGRRLPVVLMTAFGALALLLASVGIYAMFAAMAAAREREFSVRLALGSSPRGIATLVLRQGGVWMAVGLAAGAVGMLAVTRMLRSLLFGVSQFDPIALGIAVLMLAVCGTIALLVPIARATRVDLTTVLR